MLLGETLVVERGALDLIARSKSKRVLRQVQPPVLVPPGIWLCRPLRPLLRPALYQGATGPFQGPPKGRLLRQVPVQRGHRVSFHRQPTQDVVHQQTALSQIVHRPRQREKFCRLGHRW